MELQMLKCNTMLVGFYELLMQRHQTLDFKLAISLVHRKNKCSFIEIILLRMKFLRRKTKNSRADEILWHEQTRHFFFAWDSKRNMSSYDHQSMHIFPP